MNRHIRIVGIVFMGLFLLLFLQLNNLQVLQASKLANSPGNARKIIQEFAHPRGTIQTSDGVVVASSVASKDAYAYQRTYPHGRLYAGVTGYFSLVYGLDGVEQTYDQLLSGRNLPIRHLSDLLSNRSQVDDVTLTVSNQLQQVAASALGGRNGAVVALDPRTGAVRALYSDPTFDPNPLASHDSATAHQAWNAYVADPTQPLLDRAYRQRYPPGSTFKVVTSSAVFDHQPSLATKSYPQASQISLPNTNLALHNYAGEVCGGMLPELLKVSCDTGFAQVGLDLGADNLAAEATAFGFDQTPPLDLPRPAQSNFPPAASFAQNQPGLAYSAIGQENVSATPLGMALVAGAIADQGTIMVPHVMAQIRDNQGNVVQQWKARTWLQATSAATAGSVTSMMIGVVQGGTATNVALPGVQVAAKTGTAQLGLGTGQTDDWMVAFAPAGAGQTPRVAVAVVVTGQAPSATGASVAGPIVKAVLSSALAARP